jgi:hypothetical protein
MHFAKQILQIRPPCVGQLPVAVTVTQAVG